MVDNVYSYQVLARYYCHKHQGPAAFTSDILGAITAKTIVPINANTTAATTTVVRLFIFCNIIFFQ